MSRRFDPLFRHPAVELRPLTGGGYGVFSRAPLAAGTLVEECHFVAFERHENQSPELLRHAFRLEATHNTAAKMALLLGFGGLYAHAHTPNLRHRFDRDRGCFVFTTQRAVAAGEQLCVDAGRGPEPTPTPNHREEALFCHDEIEVGICVFGWGVFATADIPGDTYLEETPFITYRDDDCASAAINNYVFGMQDTGKAQETLRAFVLGYGAIFNHAQHNNVEYVLDPEKDAFVFYTTRDVSAGEQLCVSYGEDWWNTRQPSD